jgi:hypothetical protein
MKIRIEKNKRRNLSPGWANSRPIPAASLSPRARPPPSRPTSGLLPRAQQPAPRAHSLSLLPDPTRQPHSPTLFRARASLTSWPRQSATLSPSSRTASTRSPPATVLSSSPPALAAQRSSTPLRPRLLWSRPCTAPPRRAVPLMPLCTIYADCCAPHRCPPNTAAPLPSDAYKRAAPSSSMPCTGLGHSSPPPRAQPHQLRRPSLRSGELLILLPPSLVVQQAIH